MDAVKKCQFNRLKHIYSLDTRDIERNRALDLWPFDLKFAIPSTRVQGHITKFEVYTAFWYRVINGMGQTYGQRQMGATLNAAY